MRCIRLLNLVAVIFWLLPPPPASAEFKVRYPIVEYRELELEHNGSVTFDKRNSGKNNAQSFPTEMEYSFIPNWKIGVEGAVEASPGENLRYEATAIENYFQLTPQGKY